MKTTKETKEFCAHNLVSMVINDIKEYFPDTPENRLLEDFTASKTYSDLFREENGLWAEGPDYIINMYLEERKANKGGV